MSRFGRLVWRRLADDALRAALLFELPEPFERLLLPLVVVLLCVARDRAGTPGVRWVLPPAVVRCSAFNAFASPPPHTTSCSCSS
jgi:hypothetical protein